MFCFCLTIVGKPVVEKQNRKQKLKSDLPSEVSSVCQHILSPVSLPN